MFTLKFKTCPGKNSNYHITFSIKVIKGKILFFFKYEKTKTENQNGNCMSFWNSFILYDNYIKIKVFVQILVSDFLRYSICELNN